MAPTKKVRTLGEREKIISEVESNPTESRIAIAKRLGIPPSTLHSIMLKKDAIRTQISQCGKSSKKRKTSKPSTYSDVEDVLFKWYQQVRASNIPINGPILKEKALEIASRLNVDNFTASNGWVFRFKDRHGLVYKKISGESAAVDPETTKMWLEGLPKLIEGYKPCDIYNADETALFYNLMPDRTLAVKGDACHGGKISKDRLTVLLCANSDGSDKLQPLVIGKSIKPRAFKNCRVLPVKYHANKKAWMTTNVFLIFLRALDAKMGARGRKILLFLDNCSAHPQDTEFLKNVKVIYFPPNCTSKLQPMDSGVIECMKKKYRKRLVEKAVLMMDAHVEKKGRKINVLQAIHYVVGAWDQVTEATLAHCFQKCGFVEGRGEDNDDDEILCDEDNDDDDDGFRNDWLKINESEDISFSDYVGCDDKAITCDNDTIEDLCAAASTSRETEDSDNEDDTTTEEQIPSFAEAVDCVEKLKLFMYANSTNDDDIMNLIKTERAVYDQKRRAQKKQTRITDFFRA